MKICNIGNKNKLNFPWSPFLPPLSCGPILHAADHLGPTLLQLFTEVIYYNDSRVEQKHMKETEFF